jgi:hypothetical protein
MRRTSAPNIDMGVVGNISSVPLNEENSQGSYWDYQFKFAPRKNCTNVFYEPPLIARVLDPRGIKRDFVEASRSGRILDWFFAKICSHIAPRRVSMSEGMQSQYATRLGRGRSSREY